MEEDLSKLVGGATRNSLIKNKDIAPIQISAEQLIKESTSTPDPLRTTEEARRKLRQKVDKASGSAESLQRNREFFENKIRRDRHQLGVWVRYALWEEGQGGPDSGARARSIFERSLDVSPYHTPLWISYADFELRGKRLNLARNIMDRSVTLLPRVDKLWYKYLLVEEAISSNPSLQRSIWERWLCWEPEIQPFLSYIRWEQRQKSPEMNLRCIKIFQRLIKLHSKDTDSYLKFADLLESTNDYGAVRQLYKLALETIGFNNSSLLISFAKFELRRGEVERSKFIYHWGISHFPSLKTLLNSYAQFERLNCPDGKSISLSRSLMWKDKISSATTDDDLYDLYFELFDEEDEEVPDKSIYEEAISKLPKDHHSYKKWIYIWLRYFIIMEEDPSLPSLHDKLLNILEGEGIYSAKVYKAIAHYWIRKHNIDRARSIWGRSIGIIRASKRGQKVSRILEDYISVEMELEEWDRVRRLMEMRVTTSPSRSLFWIEWAHLEHLLLDEERSIFIWEGSLSLRELDNPEEVWNSYISQMISTFSYKEAHSLYERMLERSSSGHLKIFLNFSSMYYNAGMLIEGRCVMNRALVFFSSFKIEKQQLLEAWKEYDPSYDGIPCSEEISTDDHSDDHSNNHGNDSGNELLQMAKRWKKGE